MEYKDEFREKGAELKQNLQEIGSLAWKIVREKLQQLRQSETQHDSSGRESAERVDDGLTSRIRQKPLQSMLVAAGLGLVVGILWRRR